MLTNTEAQKAKDRFELDTLSTSENPRTKVLEKFDQLVSEKDWKAIDRILSRITDIETLNFLQEHYSNVLYPNDDFLEYIDNQVKVVQARTTPLTKESTEFHGKMLFKQMKKECQTLHQNAGDKVLPEKVTGTCRYKDVVPPRTTAIKNTSTKDQFYHANRVGDKHIAAQGPLPTPESISAQWNMLYETKASALVNLTNDDDRAKKTNPKKDDLAVIYWPAKGEMEEHNGLKVKTLEVEPDVESNSDLSVLTVELSKESEPPHQIKLFHYTGWPDHKVPTNRENFRHFMQQLRKVNGVKAVHCKAGMGRTGTVTELDLLMDKIQSDPTIKPENLIETTQKLVMSGREDRGKAFVQESSQMSLLLEEGLLAIDERDNAYTSVKKPRKKSTGTEEFKQDDSQGIYQNIPADKAHSQDPEEIPPELPPRSRSASESDTYSLKSNPSISRSSSNDSVFSTDSERSSVSSHSGPRSRYQSQESLVSDESGNYSNNQSDNESTDNVFRDDNPYEIPDFPDFPEFKPTAVKVETGTEDQGQTDIFMGKAAKGRDWFTKEGELKLSKDAFQQELVKLPVGALRAIAVARGAPLSKASGYSQTINNMAQKEFCNKLLDNLIAEYGLAQVRDNFAQVKYFKQPAKETTESRYAYALQWLKAKG